MSTNNPYQPMRSAIEPTQSTSARSHGKWSLIGMLILASLPLLFGTFGLYRERLYAANLPPGEVGCGMGALAFVVILFFGTPIFALIGAVGGWIAAEVWP